MCADVNLVDTYVRARVYTYPIYMSAFSYMYESCIYSVFVFVSVSDLNGGVSAWYIVVLLCAITLYSSLFFVSIEIHREYRSSV